MSIRVYNKTKTSLAMCHHFSNANATIAATHGVIVIPSCTVIYAPSTRLNTLIASCKAALEEGITSVTVKPSEANGVKTNKVTYPPLDNREGGRRMVGRGSDNGRKRQYRDDHNQWSNPRPGNKFIRTDGPSRP